jgi:hypothetical protein
VQLTRNGKGKNFRVHVLVATAFIDNPNNKQCVDHVDCNRVNNRVSNLRWATCQENSRNKSKQFNNKSGVIGVHYDKKRKKWCANITLNGKTKNLGRFATLEQAKQARINAVNKYFGEFTHSSQKH